MRSIKLYTPLKTLHNLYFFSNFKINPLDNFENSLKFMTRKMAQKRIEAQPNNLYVNSMIDPHERLSRNKIQFSLTGTSYLSLLYKVMVIRIDM